MAGCVFRSLVPGAGMFLATVALSAIAAEASPLNDIHVRLKAHALVHERQFALGDIAETTGADAGAVSRLGALRLGNSPRYGYTERLSLEEIRREVRVQLAELNPRVVWDGASAVNLETAGVPYDGRRIVEAASAHLKRTLSIRHEQVEIEPAEAAPLLQLPAGEVTLRPREIASARMPRSRMAVWVDLAVDGVFYRSVIVPLRVRIPGAALLARKDLPRGHVLAPGDLESVQVDLAALGAETAAPEVAIGGRLARSLAAGEALLQGSLEKVFAVTQGELVTLRVRSGAVEIESRALALSSGVMGQTVKVKPGTSDSAILAEVISPHVVQPSSRQP